MTKAPQEPPRKTRGPNKPKEKVRELHPDLFYRKRSALQFFGIGVTQADKMIADGVLPPLVSFGERSSGWFGRTIIAWQAAEERMAAAGHEITAATPNQSLLRMRKFVLQRTKLG